MKVEGDGGADSLCMQLKHRHKFQSTCLHTCRDELIGWVYKGSQRTNEEPHDGLLPFFPPQRTF